MERRSLLLYFAGRHRALLIFPCALHGVCKINQYKDCKSLKRSPVRQARQERPALPLNKLANVYTYVRKFTVTYIRVFPFPSSPEIIITFGLG